MNQQPDKMWSGRFREPLNHTLKQWPRSFLCCTGIAVGLLLTSVGSAHGASLHPQPKACSQSTIDHLESESDGIRSWSKLERFYRRYRACKIDDAEVTEGVSESVARMFADHWESLGAANTLFRHDPAFEKFALAGLNITDLTEDLDHIDSLATKQCPSGLGTLCLKIRKAIHDNK